MIDITLSIHRSGTTYTYPNANLLTDSAISERELNDFGLRLGDVDVLVDPEPNELRPGIVGYTNPLSIPADETWRAKIENTSTGEKVIDGAVVSGDLEFLGEQASYRVKVIEQARQDFFDLLNEYYTSDPYVGSSPNFSADRRDVEAITPDPGGGYSTETISVAELRILVAELIDQFNGNAALPDVNVDLPSGIQITDDRVWADIGRWKIGTLVREAQKFLGWRLDVSYQSFPATDYVADFYQTVWADGGSTVDLSGKEIGPGSRLEREEGGNYSIKMENQTAESSFDPADQFASTPPAGQTLYTFAAMPAWALEAPRTWNADDPVTTQEILNPDTPIIDGRTLNTDPVNTKWRLPQIQIEHLFNGARIGRPFQERAEADLAGNQSTYFTDDGGEDPFAYLMTLRQFDGKYWATHSDEGKLPNDSDTQLTCHAGENWARHEQRRNPHYRLIDEYDVDQTYKLGNQFDDFTVDGADWLIERERRDLQAGTVEWDLVSPISIEGDQDFPVQSSGSPNWIVLNLEAETRTFDRGNGKEDWVFAHWDRTPTQYAAEYLYEVELVDQDGTVTGSSQTVIFNRDQPETAVTYQLASSGNGGKQYDLRLEVTPISYDGTKGGTVEAVFGDATTTSLNYPT